MTIKELSSLSEAQDHDVISLMEELTSNVMVTRKMLSIALASTSSHFFAIVGERENIVGCASLCVFVSPTGLKACIEDVVVSSRYRGRGLGLLLMKHLIEYAKTELHDVTLHLTSSPHRVAANKMYQKLGFEKRDTNAYEMKIIKNNMK